MCAAGISSDAWHALVLLIVVVVVVVVVVPLLPLPQMCCIAELLLDLTHKSITDDT
jgi:hypothetical protein